MLDTAVGHLSGLTRIAFLRTRKILEVVVCLKEICSFFLAIL